MRLFEISKVIIFEVFIYVSMIHTVWPPEIILFWKIKTPSINSVNLKQVEVKENETAVDNLFIFTIMEINEEIDDAQSESELRGKLKIIYGDVKLSIWIFEIRIRKDSRSTQSKELLFRDGMAISCIYMVANSRDLMLTANQKLLTALW